MERWSRPRRNTRELHAVRARGHKHIAHVPERVARGDKEATRVVRGWEHIRVGHENSVTSSMVDAGADVEGGAKRSRLFSSRVESPRIDTRVR